MTITKVIPLSSPQRMMARSELRSVTMKSIKWMLLGIALILTGIGTLLGYAVVGVSGLEAVGLPHHRSDCLRPGDDPGGLRGGRLFPIDPIE